MDTCIICLDDLPEIKCQYCSLKIHKQCYLDYNKTECPQCKKFLIKPKIKDKIKHKIKHKISNFKISTKTQYFLICIMIVLLVLALFHIIPSLLFLIGFLSIGLFIIIVNK